MTLTASTPPRPTLNWQPLADPAPPDFPAGLQFWLLDLDRAPCPLRLLSPDEQARAAAYRFPTHRQRFIAGRAALRSKLAELIGVEPEVLRFGYSAHGKPFLRDSQIHFNLAHSENLALLAMAPCPIGADLERRRPVEFDLLARQVFSPGELNAWNEMSASEKTTAFYRLWTRKEALLKALACGIAEHTQHVSVFIDNHSPIDTSALNPALWLVQSLNLPPDFSAAIACPAPSPTLKL